MNYFLLEIERFIVFRDHEIGVEWLLTQGDIFAKQFYCKNLTANYFTSATRGTL